MAEKRKDSKGRNLRTGESQRKDGRYVYRWQENGKEKSVYSMDLGELREKEKQIQKDLEDGINTKAANSATLNDIFDKWIEKKRGLRESTRARYKEIYERCVRETIGVKKIANLAYSDIFDFYRHLAEDKEFAKGYLEFVDNVVCPSFDFAVKNGIIRQNPCTGVFAEIGKDFCKPTEKRHSLTLQEQNAFIDYVASSPIYSHWLPMFTVFLGTGGRAAEILGLRWDDLDFEKNTISINHALVYYSENHKYAFHIHDTKTGAGKRIVPMLKEVKEALLLIRENQNCPDFKQPVVDGYTNFVFVTKRNGTYRYTQIDGLIKDICRHYNDDEAMKAGYEGRAANLIRPFSLHNMRHTFASRLCEHETNMKAIQEIMGHANIATTMNIYAEATSEAKQQTIEKLEGKIKLV